MTDTQATTDQAGSLGPLHQPAIKRWESLLVFGLFVVAVLGTGEFIFERYKLSIKKEKQEELSGIARLKTLQITNWLAERKGNAQTLSEDPLFLAAVMQWQRQGSPSGTLKTNLTTRLDSVQQSKAVYGCTAIALFDDKANLLLSSARPGEIQHDRQLLLESLNSGNIVFSDVHETGNNNGGKLEIDFAAPLQSAGRGKKHNLGAILFHIDPLYFLFPLIQSWPTSSPSAESLLVRREGDEVAFLNELRHRTNTALAMRLPLSKKDLPASMAVLGQEGMIEGVDYRDIPVVGVITPVPGTSWKMVSKIDKAEIYAPVERLSRWILLLMLTFVAVGAAIAVYWRNKELQLIRTRQKHYEQELRNKALSKRLDYLSKYANDIIMLVDDSGKIVEFNDRALETYGYSAEEFSTMDIFRLRKIEFASQVFASFRKYAHAGSARFESLHIRKNGESFPVEISVRVVEIDGRSFQQSIIRDISERKQAEAEINRQKEFLRQVIDSDPNLIFVKDDHGKFLLANRAMAKSHNMTTESIVGKFNWELTNDLKQIEKYDQDARAVIESRQKHISLNVATLDDGRQHFLHTIRKPLPNDDGTINTLTIAMDITELKEAEDGLRRLNRSLKLLSDCNVAVAQIGDEYRLLTEICKQAVETGGYRMAWVGYVEQDADGTVLPVAKYGDDGYVESLAISCEDPVTSRGPTGTTIRTGETQINPNSQYNPLMSPWRDAALARGYLSSIALPLKFSGAVIGALTLYAAETEAFSPDESKLLEELADNLSTGISALRAITLRDQAVEKLRQSEELYRYLTENTSDVVFLLSMPNGRYDYISPAASRLTGYTPEELYKFNVTELLDFLLHPDSKAAVAQLWEKAVTGEVSPYIEYRINHRSGRTKWMGQRNTPIWNMSGGSLIAIQGVITDITERKLAEMQYETERLRLRTLVQTIPDMVWMKDTEGVYLSCNPQIERLFGTRETDIIGKTDYDFVDAELADHFRQKDRETMVANKPCINEEWVIYPDNGQRVLLETVKAPMRDEHGKLIGVIGIARDITERINSATAIRNLNADLAATLKAIPDLMFELGEDGKYIDIWAQNVELLAAQKELLLGRKVSEMLPPDAAATVMSALDEAARSGYSRGQTIKLPLPHGDSWFELSTTIKSSADASCRRFIMLSRDITERKKAEQELQFMNMLLVTEHESSIDGILVVDGSGSNILSFNRRFLEIWGISEEVVETKNDKLLLQTVVGKLLDPDQFLERVHYLYSHPEQNGLDELLLHDGKVIERYTAPMNSADGQYYGRIWYFRDISERKQAEERERSLRHVLDNTLDMIFIFRPDTLRFVYMNKGAIDSTGYDENELLAMTPVDINPTVSEAEFRKFIAPLVADNERVLRFETNHRCKSGTDLPVEVQLQLVREVSGEKMFVAVVRDITERKRAEKALRTQQAFMLQVIDTDPNRILVKDAKGNVLLANRSMATAYGLTTKEIIGKNISRIALSDGSMAIYLEDDLKVINEGRETSQIDAVELPDGQQSWLLTVKKRLLMPNGMPGVLCISADITQQKRSEIQLAESYQKLQRLSLHLENARTDERARIALNLHDEMGATLAALKMRVSWLASKLPAELPLLAEEATHISGLITDGIHTMHGIVTQLRPNLLGDVGLRAAMIDYVKKFRQHANIECVLDLPKDEIVLDVNQSHTIFRILQESLNNVAKHAQASKIDITLAERADSLVMVVRDNGIGFEPSASREQSFGLIGIRERALMVGGKARISSKPGKGTRVSVSIPHLDISELNDA